MTAYYVPEMAERYTVTFHHDFDCEIPIYSDDQLVEFDRGNDLWSEGTTRTCPRETHKAYLVHVDRRGAQSSYQLASDYGHANAVLYLSRDGQLDFHKCAELVLGEVERWANGDTWGYVVTDSRGNEVDSLWGLVGHEWAEESALADHPNATTLNA